MTIGIIPSSSDQKIPLTPDIVKKLSEDDHQLAMDERFFDYPFADRPGYEEQSVKISKLDDVVKASDILVCTGIPEDKINFKEGQIVVGRFQPFQDDTVIKDYSKNNLTLFSLDMIPRSTLAQSMDVLSSMASIAGYKAVIFAAEKLPRYFPMLTTAAGSIPPAKVLILGAGVAGLQAVATAKRLGAVVEVFDTRAAVKEEVQSLGAKFVEVEGAKDEKDAGGYAVEQSEEYLQKQKDLIAERISKSDVIITTAQLRGKPAPTLVTADMVKTMRKGSVIVDLAASTGGNCELTENDKTVEKHGVTIVGDSSLENSAILHANQLFARNIYNFMTTFLSKEGVNFDWDNDIIRSSCIVRDGKDFYHQKND